MTETPTPWRELSNGAMDDEWISDHAGRLVTVEMEVSIGFIGGSEIEDLNELTDGYTEPVVLEDLGYRFLRVKDDDTVLVEATGRIQDVW